MTTISSASTGLEVHFPIRGGLLDTIAPAPHGAVRAVDGIDLTIAPGRGPGARRRVRVGQDDDRAGHRQADPPDRRHDRCSTVQDVSASVGRRDAPARHTAGGSRSIFQDPYETLNPKQTIHDFVAEPLEVNHIGAARWPSARRESARRSSRPGCAGRDFAFRYPHELSGGQRQRVVIAGALVMGPELVVADEPVSMLDVSIRTELLRLMLDLRKERGLTYLFITHDLSLAWVIADRIAVMYLGKIMEIGPADVGHPTRPAPLHGGARLGRADAGPADRHARRPARSWSARRPTPPTIPAGCRFHPRCPLVFDRCRTEEPPLFDVGEGQSGRLLAGRARTAAGAARGSGGGDAVPQPRAGRVVGRLGQDPRPPRLAEHVDVERRAGTRRRRGRRSRAPGSPRRVADTPRR